MIKYSNYEEELIRNNSEYELVINDDKYSNFYGKKDKDLDDVSKYVKKMEEDEREIPSIFKSEIDDVIINDDDLALIFEDYIEEAREILGFDTSEYDGIVLEPDFGIFVDTKSNETLKYVLAFHIPAFKYIKGDMESEAIKFSDESRKKNYITSYLDFRIGVSMAESKLEGMDDFDKLEENVLNDKPVCKIIRCNQPVKNYTRVSER